MPERLQVRRASRLGRPPPPLRPCRLLAKKSGLAGSRALLARCQPRLRAPRSRRPSPPPAMPQTRAR
eukprot:5423795-Pleurochrysis_carterae.AAC.1